MSDGHCAERRLGSMLVVSPVVCAGWGKVRLLIDCRGRWGGRLLQTNYASSNRRGQLVVGSPSVWDLVGATSAAAGLLLSSTRWFQKALT